MSCPTDLTDEQWEVLEPVFNAPGKRGRKHADELRSVVDAMLYIARTGCQWRYLPESFGSWTRVWSQFRRWSRNGTWARALTALHAAACEADRRTEATPSMVVIDTHLARGAANGGFTFHDRGGRMAPGRLRRDHLAAFFHANGLLRAQSGVGRVRGRNSQSALDAACADVSDDDATAQMGKR